MASAGGVSAGAGANGVNGANGMNGANGVRKDKRKATDDELLQLTLQLRNKRGSSEKYAKFHGDRLIGYSIPKFVGFGEDAKVIFAPKNWPVLGRIISKYVEGQGLDTASGAKIMGSLSDYSKLRQNFIDSQVKSKYDKMLHPPLTYLGDAFQYRTADGKFNSVINPHLGQAGAPYAKTVPSKTPPLGALPDPGDLFDKLMARKDGGRESKSGLSSMLVYHATIIIHDIFRTNDNDKNISDSSSYLDLSPLYGYTMDMQRQVRDGKYGHGLLKPDTFAEDRLLRQPPGVCIMLVMYNRYHNYAAKQLYRINENNRFSVPSKYKDAKLASLTKYSYLKDSHHSFEEVVEQCEKYDKAWKKFEAAGDKPDREVEDEFRKRESKLEAFLKEWKITDKQRKDFEAGYDAAWTKLDDDLFNTARLITCGMYIQVSIHDYLRALMGFHQWNTNFTLDPRTDFDQRQTTRGLGNQVTVEFNLLYRFHCAISLKDEKYTEDLFKSMGIPDPANLSLPAFLQAMAEYYKKNATDPNKDKPWARTFGIPDPNGTPGHSTEYKRNKITNLFDDQQMIDALTNAMDTPISNFGPCNVPKSLKAVEMMGILQARKWEVGTLNDFREFFGMDRHQSFESISKNPEIQDSLRDLYENPDKVELYPGIFCESDEYMGLDPGPEEANSALWSAIFSDAITLVRSDRFYTVDWNTNSLTSWGMNEVTPDNEICKSSVFHRLIQRAFPSWFEYDSIRFFHPFYTAAQNKKYAIEQGYGPEFSSAKPAKPQKPVNLTNVNDIGHVLDCRENTFIHPVLHHGTLLTEQLKEVLQPKFQRAAYDATLNDKHLIAEYQDSEPALRGYLKELMRSIIKRQSISMTNATFQIDVTRDFAIPVATRYVADFLGFGHLLRTENNPHGSYSENEIYQHITNCQIFLSYNADETKIMKRAKAFSNSMKFLTDLTMRANIASASQWEIYRALFGRKRDNPITELGFSIARRLLSWTRDASKAAATLLLISLDLAYDSVISFTAVVDHFMQELYDAANKKGGPKQGPPAWLKVQELAFNDENNTGLDDLIWQTARATVKLPVVRIATKEISIPVDGTSQTVRKNQTIIMDIQKAAEKIDIVTIAKKQATGNIQQETQPVRVDVLGAKPIFGTFGAAQASRFNMLALTSMVKFIAQMKTPRRGHHTQGRLKQVFLDWTAEGYSNYMAPGRMYAIREQVKHLPEGDEDKKIFTDKVLKPSTDTYLTPNWDEMVPFPMTWKIRFDGFGKSDYSSDGNPYGRLEIDRLPDDTPPWYQPQGLSHIGGSFANVSLDVEGRNNKAVEDLAPKAAANERTVSNGCGLTY